MPNKNNNITGGRKSTRSSDVKSSKVQVSMPKTPKLPRNRESKPKRLRTPKTCNYEIEPIENLNKPKKLIRNRVKQEIMMTALPKLRRSSRLLSHTTEQKKPVLHENNVKRELDSQLGVKNAKRLNIASPRSRKTKTYAGSKAVPPILVKPHKSGRKTKVKTDEQRDIIMQPKKTGRKPKITSQRDNKLANSSKEVNVTSLAAVIPLLDKKKSKAGYAWQNKLNVETIAAAFGISKRSKNIKDTGVALQNGKCDYVLHGKRTLRNGQRQFLMERLAKTAKIDNNNNMH